MPAHKEVIDEVKAGYDVMVAGVGDRGSCSSRNVLDGILLEKNGIPSAEARSVGQLYT